MKKAKAKSTLTARDRVLLLVLPGALVLALYAVLVNGSHIGALTKANQQFEKLRGTSGNMPMSATMLASEVQRLKTELADVQRKLAAFTDGGSDALQRSEAVVMVGSLLRKHGMVVIDEGPSAKQNTSTVSTRSSANKQPIATNADSVWQVRFLGTWSGVQATLEALPDFEGSTCLPLSLSMAEPQTPSPVREWTLRLRL